MLHHINSIHTIWVATTHGVNINALHGQKELQNSLVLSSWNPADPTLAQLPHFAHLSSKNMKHHGVYVNISIILSLSESGNKKKRHLSHHIGPPAAPSAWPWSAAYSHSRMQAYLPRFYTHGAVNVEGFFFENTRYILSYVLYINISSTLACTCLSSNSHQTCHIPHCKNIDIWTALHHPRLLHQVFVLHVFLSGQVLHRRVLQNQLCYSKVL